MYSVKIVYRRYPPHPGTAVRNLKSNKAAKPEIDAAVKVLLDLKSQFKAACGQDWKPGIVIAAAETPVAAAAPAAPTGEGPEEPKRKRTSSTSSSKSGRRSRTSSRSESICEAPEWAATGDALALNGQIIGQGNKIRWVGVVCLHLTCWRRFLG